ncbi:hypothetical protein [Kitasatospora sp. HPMI-4]|uniref:hypothetical protein n=1 Tax=Kitasatospora sp. HPMI-4 TaxID=3448443 RepID=UPI003F1DD1AE
MNQLLVLDLGDVLVRTAPGAQYQALHRLTGTPPNHWAEAADPTGLTEELERGELDFAAFAATLCERTSTPLEAAPLKRMRKAFNKTVHSLDPAMAWAVRPFAQQNRLLLASNTSEPHWQRIRELLTADGFPDVPACLSFEIGHRKPANEFFHALAALDPRVSDSAVFLDDRPEHVAAASRHGLTGIRHYDTATSATYLAGLLAGPPTTTLQRS